MKHEREMFEERNKQEEDDDDDGVFEVMVVSELKGKLLFMTQSALLCFLFGDPRCVLQQIRKKAPEAKLSFMINSISTDTQQSSSTTSHHNIQHD